MHHRYTRQKNNSLRMAWDDRFHHTFQDSEQFKTCKLFLQFSILAFSDNCRVWLKKNEKSEKEIIEH